MAFCINCGQELADGTKFCPNCGKAVDGNSSNSQRKTTYDGELHKCPNCGEILNSFITNCPTCGHELRNTQSVSSVKSLAVKLEQLEAQRPCEKGLNIFRMAISGRSALQNVDKQKIDLIKNFSIPNTKEDVLEFIVLAAANVDLKMYGMNSGNNPAGRELSDAWLAKLEQADNKAEIMFGHTNEYLAMRNVYENKLKAIKKQKRQIIWYIVGILGLYIFVFLLALLATNFT